MAECNGVASECKLRSLALLLLTSALLLSSGGCANKATETSKELAANITRSLSSQHKEQNAGSPVGPKQIYLDASVSMKGFVNPAQHSQFDEFIDAVGDALPGCQIYKYGQRKSGPATAGNQQLAEKVSFGLELHQPGFYDLAYNPDDRLIEQLAAEAQPALSILITDGVYSEPQGATSPPVVQAIQKWLDRGCSFGILILKSSFNGPFYSERGRTLLPKISVKGRPFYAFIFSPTERDFREVQERLTSRFPEAQVIFFSDNAISCAPVINLNSKGTYDYSVPPQTPFYWQMFDTDLFKQSDPAPITYGINCTLSQDYPVGELAFDLAPEYYKWLGGKEFKKVDADPPRGFKYDMSSVTPATAKLIVYFPKDTSTDYGFYYLKVAGRPKTLRPEIQELSTRDDLVIDNANKTFRFLELIDSLTNTHFEKRLAPIASTAIFVTIRNH